MPLILKNIEVTPQGYYYAKVNALECTRWGGYGICDTCGKPFIEDGHLVFVLNSCICGKCFEDWQRRAQVWEEDLHLQKEASEAWFKHHLGDLINMPDEYNKSRIEELNNENIELLSKVKELDKEIDSNLRDIFPEAFKGVDDSGKEN